MRRKLFIALALAAIIAVAGCASEPGPSEQEKDLADDTGQNVSGIHPGPSYHYEIKMTEKNQRGLVRAQPPFTMESSLERANLIRRYQYLNDRNNVHHVYLMSNDGKVIAYFVAQGKVSSVNSKLTNDVQVVQGQACRGAQRGSGHYDDPGNCHFRVESPQMDGSYGTNGAAIFFFTTDGEYVEYNGKYVVSEQPLNIQTAISLEHDVGEDDNSTEG